MIRIGIEISGQPHGDRDRAAVVPGLAVGGEAAGQDRDDRERDREVREPAPRPVQALFVAELREEGLVLVLEPVRLPSGLHALPFSRDLGSGDPIRVIGRGQDELPRFTQLRRNVHRGDRPCADPASAQSADANAASQSIPRRSSNDSSRRQCSRTRTLRSRKTCVPSSRSSSRRAAVPTSPDHPAPLTDQDRLLRLGLRPDVGTDLDDPVLATLDRATSTSTAWGISSRVRRRICSRISSAR